ncbi:MAG: hypothetical protein WC863_04070 [Patescibacteria group bacterium]
MKKIKKISTSLLLIFLFALTSQPILAEDDDYDDYEENNYRENNDDRPEVISAVEETSAPVTPRVSTIDAPAATGFLPTVNITNSLIDSDQDGIIDILDTHPGEDDFAFRIQDANKNGLIDDLEYLMNK